MQSIQKENSFEQISNEAFIEDVSHRIRPSLNTYFDDLYRDNVIVIGEVWGGQETARTFRFTIKVKSKEKKHVVFVKLCPKFDSINPAKMEYETLCVLHDKMPLFNNNCSVPRPLEYFPDLNAYAMESVGSINFKPFLLRNNSRLRGERSLSKLFSIVSGCGSWLWTFHKITEEVHKVKFDATLFMESLNQECDYRSMGKYSFQKVTLDRIEKIFENLTLVHDKISLSCAKWHWDFTPGHVFLDNGKIAVIDITGIDNIPIFEDIGRFLASMSTINSFPFYPLFDYDRARGPLSDAFLEAYLSKTDCEREVFLLCTEVYRLKYLVIWFFGQQFRVGCTVNPSVTNFFTNIKLVPIFEKAMTKTIDAIEEYLYLWA